MTERVWPIGQARGFQPRQEGSILPSRSIFAVQHQGDAPRR
jgi:hypothetical protein